MEIIKENCRLCQRYIGTIHLKEDITNIIVRLANIDVTDPLFSLLPNKMCILCNTKILEADLFIREIQNVDKYLKNCLEQSDVPENEESKITIENISISERTKFVCPICFKTCRSLSTFKRHKKIHPDLYCFDCNTVLDIAKESADHKCEKIKRKKKNECIQVKSEIENELDDFKVENEDQHYCTKCDEHFENNKSYAAHLRVHNMYTCPEDNCLKAYTSAYSLKIHKLNHEGKRLFLCVSCGKSFISKKSLICHEKTHDPVKAHRCDSCNISFSIRSNFRAHIKRHHENVRYHCSQCPREFINKCNLDRHEKIHTGVKEFKCDLCTSAFYTKKEFLRHQKYHQGLKQHKCEQCFKTFFERHHLTIHLRSHTGERPYICDIPDCGKSFYDNQKLKRHKKSLHV